MRFLRWTKGHAAALAWIAAGLLAVGSVYSRSSAGVSASGEGGARHRIATIEGNATLTLAA